jgi:hypothetical protein
MSHSTLKQESFAYHQSLIPANLFGTRIPTTPKVTAASHLTRLTSDDDHLPRHPPLLISLPPSLVPDVFVGKDHFKP